MKDLREKITNLLEAYALQRIDGGETGLNKIYTEAILALFEQCPAMTIESCPWGKKNVDFREILLRGINRQLEGIGVEEECPAKRFHRDNFNCELCHGTGKIRRPATLKDIPIKSWYYFIAEIEASIRNPILRKMTMNTLNPERFAYLFTTPTGGRLVIKNE